ncbi:MAG TPA: type I-U CRISPR-associated RAMP protein Csb1/Cas7u [Solirubrobacterales bacterium]|nr:type I-U CRISPR-associated RAMP protein Csb1/Cas7u [Solirubrobacterales bacterium]
MEITEALREGLSSDPVANRPAGIEIRQLLRPAAGMSVKPPAYEGNLEIHSRKIDGIERQTIELDSVGSSANRIEDALIELFDAGEYPLPVATTTIEPGEDQPKITVTTLAAPHRIFDGWLRLSEDENSVRFEDTEQGHDLTLAHVKRLDALLETSSHDLLFGAWDSHRTGPHGQVRIARSLTTSLLGLDPQVQQPVAARRDPLNLGEASDSPKGAKKLSEQGLSSIPPQRTKETVAIDQALFQGYLSFPSLRRLGFENYNATEVRVMLAWLGLFGLLLRADQGWDLRSGAALIPQEPMEFKLARPDGTSEVLELDLATARRELDASVAKVGIKDRHVRLQAGKTLNDLVAKSISAAKKQV